ncbi:MAG: hypothetical protein WC967_02390 [Balneolaceae bacterium]
MKTQKLLLKNSSLWQWILFSFVLAGLTGFLFRLGFLTPLPFELSLANIRQAHSHLMFFGWGGLFPLYFISIVIMPGYHAALSSRMIRYSLWVVLAFTLLSFPTFLLWGYQLVPIGGANLPISAILSAGVMIGWYMFFASFLAIRRKKKEIDSNIWFEGALLMLFVSSLGAWAVGVVQIFGIGPEFLEKLLPNFFLTTYTEGWILLALLGFVIKMLDIKEADLLVSSKILVFCIAIGAPMSFPFGMPALLSNPMQSLFARIGSFLVSTSVLLFVASIIKSGKLKHSLWKWPIAFLCLKGLMQFVATFLFYDPILTNHGTRILYLHVLFLGAYTSAVSIIYASYITNLKRYLNPIFYSVVLVLFSLLLLSWFWPLSLIGTWIYDALAIAALGPVLTVTALWIKLRTRTT